MKNCPCGKPLPKGNNTFCKLCSLIPRPDGLPIVAPTTVKEISGDELGRLCFCNSDKLLNMVLQLNDGSFNEWISIGWVETDDLAGKIIYRTK